MSEEDKRFENVMNTLRGVATKAAEEEKNKPRQSENPIADFMKKLAEGQETPELTKEAEAFREATLKLVKQAMEIFTPNPDNDNDAMRMMGAFGMIQGHLIQAAKSINPEIGGKMVLLHTLMLMRTAADDGKNNDPELTALLSDFVKISVESAQSKKGENN